MVPQLADFRGNWRLERQIAEATGACAHFAGQAVFAPEGAGLRYHETGVLTLSGGASMRAERSYLWHAEGAEIVVSFADGRDFHRFAPAAPEARHWCDPDHYRVAYDFSRWPDWAARWQVRGPRKDYVMRTHYTRD